MPGTEGRLRVGLIGCGRIGAVHAQAWRDCPGVLLAGAADPDEEARGRAVEQGIPAFAAADRMLDAAGLDAVSICTPPCSHAELASRCLNRGLHVLCEKPLTTDLPSAVELWETAAGAPGELLVAAKFRHVPEIQKARELVRAGEIGRVIDFKIEFASPVPMANRWNSVRSVSGGGVIIDNGCHAFDLVCFLFGGIAKVEARLGEAPQGLEVEESATISITAGGGEAGLAALSWSAPAAGDDYLSIQGERGSVHVGWKGSSLRRGTGETIAFGGPYDKTAAHARMMSCFRDVVDGRARPWISMDESLGIAAALDAAYRSCRSRAEESVHPPARATVV